MKTIGMTALAALAAVALVSFASHGESNEKTGSLTQRLQGSWTMVSNVLDQDGKKSEPFGPSAKGGVIFSVCDQLQVPVRFVGTGERPQDLAPFEPREFVEALFAS